MSDIPTSEGTLLSSIHGRDRRSLRSIGKKDLLAAKKYGIRERTYGYNRKPRWKFTFADIVYITEDDKVTEVTSYVLPVDIPLVEVSLQDHASHEALAAKLRKNPSMCSSHIVIVIDQSASMKTCDVDQYKTRSDAVYATIALDYIGNQIDHRFKTNANYTDAVTLIEMSTVSNTIIRREPCTNVLFNKLIQRKSYVTPRGHGNYSEAIITAYHELLPDGDNDNCTLFLLFLSDGKPSDFIKDPFYDAGQHMFELCRHFGQQLTVMTLGFGKRGSDFHVLEMMAARARDAGSAGSFKAVDTNGDGLSSTIASLSDTMSSTRLMGSVLHLSKHQRPRTIRVVDVEPDRGPSYDFKMDRDNINDGTWTMYREGFNRFKWDKRTQRSLLVMAQE